MTELLFGADNSERIVRIEVSNNIIYEYIQDENGNTYCNTIQNFEPAIFCHSPLHTLKGDNYYNHIEYLQCYKDYNYIYDPSRENYLKINNLPSHYLIQSGKTLFKGMTFDEITTMGFDIEADGLDPYRAKIINDCELGRYIPKPLYRYQNEILAYFQRCFINDEYIILQEIFKDIERINNKIDIKFFINMWELLYRNDVIEDYGDQVRMISTSTNTGHDKVIHEGYEADLINDFVYEVYLQDPNLLLGFNSNNYDVPFLKYRALVNKIVLGIGREGREPEMCYIQLRLDGGGSKRMISYNIFGRNYVDLHVLVKKFDFTDRKLNNYGLKNIMAVYGLEKQDRIKLDNSQIQEGLNSDPQSQKYKDTIEYCLDDSKDLINLHRYIAQADFYLTQMLPFNYDTLVFQGNSGRWNNFILREYMKQGYSVPKWEKYLDYENLETGSLLKYKGNNTDLEKDEVYEVVNKTEYVLELKNISSNKTIDVKPHELMMFSLNIEGASVQAEDTGIYDCVVDSDVGSMYPSLMIKYNIFPATDILGVMKQALLELRAMRFVMKKEANNTSKSSSLYKVLKSKDTAFKVHLNSAFGVLGVNGFHFKDSNKCAGVTRHGRELINTIKDFILGKGFKVISLDTDGISYTNGKKPDIDLINDELMEFLPEGITIETEYYKHSIIFAKKTYCAIKENGEIKIRGSALSSSGIPAVVKRFINKMVPLLAERKFEEVKIFFKNIKLQITNNELPVDEYTQTQKITRTIAKYLSNLQTQANPRTDKVYELAIETNKDLAVGDKVETYHVIKTVKKKTLTKKEEADKKNFELMGNMFGTEYVYPTEDIDGLKWAEDFNDDINKDYYINFLNNTAQRLLLKIYDEKKGRTSGVLSKEQFEYIVETESKNINDYKYMDYAYVVPSIKSMSAWERIEDDKCIDMIKEGKTDAYVTIQKFSNEVRTDVEMCYHPLYFDIDGVKLKYAFDDALCIYMFFKNYLKVDDKYIKVWFSGSKGFHIEVASEVFGLKPQINLQLINKEIAKMLIDKYKLTTIDIGSIYSKKRMWRLPFSINSKSGRRKMLINNFDDFNSVSEIEMYVDDEQKDITEALNQFIATFKENRCPTTNLTLKHWISEYIKRYEDNLFREIIKKNKELYSKLNGKIPKCVKFLLENSITQAGDRNRATVVLASFFKESGRSKEETIEILTEFTENIKKDLTSIKSCAIIQNVTTVVNSVYNSQSYTFQCYYIKSLLKNRGFKCDSSCELKD